MIIGGGMSGLAAAWQLKCAGLDAILVEGRQRVGGRVLTVDADAACDLGPSWFWRGQPLIAQLLNEFQISYYEQFSSGDILYQQPDGTVSQLAEPSPMTGALRISGGIGSLADAIAKRLSPDRIRLEHKAQSITLSENLVRVRCQSPTGEVTIEADQVVLALPPRLAAAITIDPALPAQTLEQLKSTPTWMAGHAKFFAVYDQPFWRQRGLCGTAISGKGPLTEIHDASPESERCFSLFGFAGLPPSKRLALGREQFIQLATQQLVDLFGADAAAPTAVHFLDWSFEDFTAAPADRVPQTRHPQYGLRPDAGAAWQDRIHFISSETSFVNGGLIEGALEGAHRLVSKFAPSPAGESQSTPHAASMGWDWL